MSIPIDRITSDAASTPMRETAVDQPYRVRMLPDGDDRAQQFGRLIKAAREQRGWSQDDLADEADVGRATVQRYERGDLGKSGFPDPGATRKIFKALNLDQREAPVILGFVTREEIGLPPKPERVLSPTIEEVIEILQDPQVPDQTKQEWIEYLKYRTRRRGAS